MIREVMDIREVAEYLGMGTSKIYQLVERREIPASKIGRQYRFPKPIIDAWLESHLVIEDKEFLSLLHDLRKEAKNAGTTQKDLHQAVAAVRKKAKARR